MQSRRLALIRITRPPPRTRSRHLSPRRPPPPHRLQSRPLLPPAAPQPPPPKPPSARNSFARTSAPCAASSAPMSSSSPSINSQVVRALPAQPLALLAEGAHPLVVLIGAAERLALRGALRRVGQPDVPVHSQPPALALLTTSRCGVGKQRRVLDPQPRRARRAVRRRHALVGCNLLTALPRGPLFGSRRPTATALRCGADDASDSGGGEELVARPARRASDLPHE